MRTFLFLPMFATLAACGNPDGMDPAEVTYGPSPALEATCASPYGDAGNMCGHIWSYDEDGNQIDLATIQVAGEADPDGSADVEVGDHAWFHYGGEGFVAFWPSDYTFDYELHGQEVWLDPAECASTMEGADNMLTTEDWNCVLMYP